jgi:hypothetical protein
MDGYYKIKKVEYIDSNNLFSVIDIINYYDNEKNLLTSECYTGEIRSNYNQELVD